MTHYIIEGVDRLGKGTLIENIQQDSGPYMVQHFDKPLISSKIKNNLNQNCHGEVCPDCQQPIPCARDILKQYQVESFMNGFRHLLISHIPTIFDRFHLGECVYAPLYRGYSGDYVFEQEKFLRTKSPVCDIRLVLLVTSDFSFIVDDGLSIDFNKRKEEQDMFISAFHKSDIDNKIIIDVNHDGKFADPLIIRDLAINNNVKTISTKD